MSRIAKAPIAIASGVEFKVDGQKVSVKGSKGTTELEIHSDILVSLDDGVVTVDQEVI